MEHKSKLVPGFSQKYETIKLVYYEYFTDVQAAIAREKLVKKWRREKKDALVRATNPEWRDLSEEWF